MGVEDGNFFDGPPLSEQEESRILKTVELQSDLQSLRREIFSLNALYHEVFEVADEEDKTSVMESISEYHRSVDELEERVNILPSNWDDTIYQNLKIDKEQLIQEIRESKLLLEEIEQDIQPSTGTK